MTHYDKLLNKILRGTSDAQIPFEQLCGLMVFLDFDERICGSHHIFSRDDIEEIINIQPNGAQAKPYQVRQVRNVILKYRLGENDD
jgi:hypothetical protein